MPQFELAEKDTNIIGTATFEKKEDYMVINLQTPGLKKGEFAVDPTNHLVHVIHGQKLIDKGVAVKGKASLSKREIQTVVTEDPEANKNK